MKTILQNNNKEKQSTKLVTIKNKLQARFLKNQFQCEHLNHKANNIQSCLRRPFETSEIQ